jgi:hypothetical protein
MNLVVQILWIYVIIKPVLDPMRSMTMVFPLKCILYMIATDPGTITMIQGVGVSFQEPSLFQLVSKPCLTVARAIDMVDRCRDLYKILSI